MISSCLFLGSGSSVGVPLIGCKCEVCTSKSPFNKRYRSSILLKIGDKRLLVDAGPDLREQALKNNMTYLDGVIFTHSHQDHTGGIDDLRAYSFLNKASFPCLASAVTAEDIYRRYYFMFQEQPNEKGFKRLKFEILPAHEGEGEFMGVKFKYFTYTQLGMPVNGFVFGNFAYVTDIHIVEDSIFKHLNGIETLVVSSLRFTPSHMHFSVDQAIDFARKTGAKKTYLTHTSHELDYYKTNTILPDDIRLAYDGLEIPFLG